MPRMRRRSWRCNRLSEATARSADEHGLLRRREGSCPEAVDVDTTGQSPAPARSAVPRYGVITGLDDLIYERGHPAPGDIEDLDLDVLVARKCVLNRGGRAEGIRVARSEVEVRRHRPVESARPLRILLRPDHEPKPRWGTASVAH